MATGVRRVGAAVGPPVGLADLAGVGNPSRPTMEQATVVTGGGTLAAQSPAAGGTGIMDAVFPAVPYGRVWLVERINVSSTSTNQTSATAYLGDAAPTNQADLTRNGEGDVADEVKPIIVPAGVTLRIRWVGASVGAVGTAVIQYQEAAQVSRPIA